MPELPEVETVRRGLQTQAGQRILAVQVTNAKVLKGQSELEFRARVAGQSIGPVLRRGKYLLASLSPDVSPLPFYPITLCVHLKMRGQILLVPTPSPLLPYHCVSLSLANGLDIRFHDMWTWGEMRALTDSELASVKSLREMGEEPLDEAWTVDGFAARLTKRGGPIKAVLLDQSTVAGVGNIYADESLYRAGIAPTRRANSLDAQEAARLHGAIVAVLTEAVTGGGTTSEEYTDVSGAAGRYVPQVYNKGGQPCPACGTLLSRTRIGGRGTVYCGVCQPEQG